MLYSYPTLSVSHLRALRDILAQKVFGILPVEETKGDKSFMVYADGSYKAEMPINYKISLAKRPVLLLEKDVQARANHYLDALKDIKDKSVIKNLGGISLLPDGVVIDRIEKAFPEDSKGEGWYWTVACVLKLRPSSEEDAIIVQGAGVQIDIASTGNIMRLHSTVLPIMQPKKDEGFEILDLSDLSTNNIFREDNNQLQARGGTVNSVQNIILPKLKPLLFKHNASNGTYSPFTTTNEGDKALTRWGVEVIDSKGGAKKDIGEEEINKSDKLDTGLNIIAFLYIEGRMLLEDITENKNWLILPDVGPHEPAVSSIVDIYESINRKLKKLNKKYIDTLAFVHHGNDYGTYNNHACSFSGDNYTYFIKARKEVSEMGINRFCDNEEDLLNEDYDIAIIEKMKRLKKDGKAMPLEYIQALLSFEKMLYLVKPYGTYISIGCSEYDSLEEIAEFSNNRLNIYMSSNLVHIERGLTLENRQHTPSKISIGSILNHPLSETNFINEKGWCKFSPDGGITATGVDLQIRLRSALPFGPIKYDAHLGDNKDIGSAFDKYHSKLYRKWLKTKLDRTEARVKELIAEQKALAKYPDE